ECPCLLTAEQLRELHNGTAPPAPPPGLELPPGAALSTPCANCTCVRGRLRCGERGCRRDGGFGPWGPWSPCSPSCGGLGLATRWRGCTRPTPAHGGLDCAGPRADTRPCRSPPCPAVTVPTAEPSPTAPGSEEEEGFGAWTPWTPCSRTCTRPEAPATRSRSRPCARAGGCRGASAQQRPCNLPHCAGGPRCPPSRAPCSGEACVGRDCAWTPWGPWGACSRSCGGGQQLRLRAYSPPGPGGRWCPRVRSAHAQRRFCGLQACTVDGAWSPWGHWSACDRTCGGGRSLRSRSCTRPPPKNGGRPCPGERHRLRLCNAQPCGGGCPPEALVPCANRCPRRCRDLREGVACAPPEPCQPGCRCPPGTLEQDGGCVPPAQCECRDADGHAWAPGSRQRRAARAAPAAGASCAATPGPARRPPARHGTGDTEACDTGARDTGDTGHGGHGTWEVTEDTRGTGHGGHRTRGAWDVGGDRGHEGHGTRGTQDTGGMGRGRIAFPAGACEAPQEQSRGCGGAPCPPPCPPHALGERWPEGACRECTCTPEGAQCRDLPCADTCPWSPWSPWTPCSCQAPRGHRHRHRRGPPGCAGLQAQSRPCDLSGCSEASCAPPFRYRPCGPPCAQLCASRLHPEICPRPPPCQPGCACPQGLLEQGGACVPPAQCGCLRPAGDGDPRPLAAGETLLLGCRHCVCENGTLRCSDAACAGRLPLSPWAEWGPCGACEPPPTPDPRATTPRVGGRGAGAVQRRYRACLDPQSGLAWGGGGAACQAPLRQERPCPDPRPCQDPEPCVWGPWGPWGPCRDPCGGGFRLRHRRPCRDPRTQTQSCAAACPGEACEERGRVFDASCANACPRACADRWPHVECLQGPCQPGCRCPPGQLLQDGACVPAGECRCGLPSANGSRELRPGQAARLSCHNCTCANGTLGCPATACPAYGPWAPWSPCSRPCGGGRTARHRGCQRSDGGEPCAAARAWDTAGCNTQPCPAPAAAGGGAQRRRERLPEPGGRRAPCPLEPPLLLLRPCAARNCSPGTGGSAAAGPGRGGWGSRAAAAPSRPAGCPPGQEFGRCANACPRACAHLWPHVECLRGPCQPGCACPRPQVLQDGACVPPELCRCQAPPAPPAAPTTARGSSGSTRPARACATAAAAVSASAAPSTARGRSVTPVPRAERWRDAEAQGDCERSCRDLFGEGARNCSGPPAPGCACQPGRYRDAAGRCVPPALCECWHGGRPRQPRVPPPRPASRWQEQCRACRCAHGRVVCAPTGCPPLACPEGAVKVREPGGCCPVCREEWPEEPPGACRRLTELRAVAKGPCRLPAVEVAYCAGRCRSGTAVSPEEPYLRSACECCGYRLDPREPVRVLRLPCPDGRAPAPAAARHPQLPVQPLPRRGSLPALRTPRRRWDPPGRSGAPGPRPAAQ
ncbi:LOW QUALITY PROTEIN: SCO-spondin-like, partial [Chlamydotis macqueenii]